MPKISKKPKNDVLEKFFLIDPNNFNVNLTQSDINSGSFINLDTKKINFPVLHNKSYAGVKKLSNGYKPLDKSDSTTDKLCKERFCSNAQKIYIKDQKQVDSKDCLDKSCSEITFVLLTYNCIGWAHGVPQWIQPSLIDSYIKKNAGNREKGIKEFISKYRWDKEVVSLDVVTKLKYFTTKLPSEVSNNMISYYFDNKGHVTHAARYVEEIYNQNINKWTSKLGEGYLISHESGDLSGNESLYGDPYVWYSNNELSTPVEIGRSEL